jgi:DNA gyrase subunit A
MQARDEDFVNQLFVASTHDTVFFFSDKGKVYVKKVYEVPEAARNAKGRAIVNFVGLEPGEKVAAVTPVLGFVEGHHIVTLTKKGQIKKTEVVEYQNFREKGIIGVRIEESDELLSATVTDGTREFIIATRGGMSIRFPEEQVRATGRATMGVKAIELAEGDDVVGLSVTDDSRTHVLVVSENGYGKQTSLEEFRLQHRGGKGLILMKTSERNGPVVGISLINNADELMIVTNRGQMIRTKVSEIRETGRNAQGVKLMTLEEGERVVGIERLAETVEIAESSESPTSSEPPPDSGPVSASSIPAAPPWSVPPPSSDPNGSSTPPPIDA